MNLSKEFPFISGVPAFLWQILFFYIPLAFLVVSSIIHYTAEGQFAGLTLQHFRPLFSSNYLFVIFSSFLLAFSTAILCVCIAFPLAHFIAFHGGRAKTLLLFFLIVPFWTNFLLHVSAWFFVLERDGFLNIALQAIGLTSHPIHFLNSIFAMMVMMVYYYLPFMVLPIYSSLERFDLHLLEASNTLGASWWQTFRRITLPLTMPAIRAGFFLVFIPAFGEFIIPELMAGGKYFFVGNVISEYMLGEQTEGLGAAFTVMSVFALIVATLLFYWLFKRLSSKLKGVIR